MWFVPINAQVSTNRRALPSGRQTVSNGVIVIGPTGPIIVRSEQSNHHRPGVERRMVGLLCVVDSRFSAPKKRWQFLEQASMRMDCDQRSSRPLLTLQAYQGVASYRSGLPVVRFRAFSF